MSDNLSNSNKELNHHIHQEINIQHQMQQQDMMMSTSGGHVLPWTSTYPPGFNPPRDLDNPFLFPQQSPTISYEGIFNRSRPTGLQFGYESLGQGVGPFGLHAELQKMTAQDIMDAKALAASKNHSEAERRRRERINNHLAKLRSLLPNTTKTDKASLLAEVIQHLKELKRQTCLIAETNGPVPTETDELTVDNASDEDGRLLIRASICCEDRSDLLPDLIRTLKSLRLRTLKAEITTLGGRVKNVLFITGENEMINDVVQQEQYCSITSIQEALKGVVQKANGDEPGSGNAKRQRTNVSL